MDPLVAAYLAVDRAQGSVAVFLGFSRSELESTGQLADMEAALKTLDDAMSCLQKLIYEKAGVV